MLGVLIVLLGESSIGAFQVDSAMWCQTVDVVSHTPVQSTLLNASTVQDLSRVKALTFWTRLVGTEDDIHLMEQAHKLPLKHVWEYEAADLKLYHVTTTMDQSPEPRPAASSNTLSAKDSTVHASVTLDLGSPATFNLLRQEVESEHAFLWRTWSAVTALRAGTWQVTVEYADNTPVYCQGQIARYLIELQ